MPISIPSYYIYLATTFEVIGWWNGVGWGGDDAGEREEREATMTINKAINLLA
jgi:hypothetical protein